MNLMLWLLGLESQGFLAITLAENGLRVGVVTREEDPKVSNTYWAEVELFISMKETMISFMIFKKHQQEPQTYLLVKLFLIQVVKF